MKVSLVIPAYNEEKYIKECLIHIMAQQVRPDEIIIVDNNCNDATMDLVKHFPVKVVKEEVQGMTAARNKGFNTARGDIIARCDADSHLPPDWIRRVKDNFETKKMDALTGPVEFYDLKVKAMPIINLYFDFIKPVFRNEVLSGPNMILTRQMWERVKNDVCLNDSKVHEDIDLSIHITAAHGVIARDHNLIVYISGRRIKKNPQSFFGEYPLRFMKTLLYHKKNIIASFLDR
jgi:glycosyltransferase involved in cell wall biosynthesis